jgi:steroid delta-isomerase-like uncharacterized protein
VPTNIDKIKLNVRRYVAACNAGDAEAFRKTLAKNVVFMPPDGPKLKGDKATAAWVKKTFFDPFRNTLRVKFDRLQVIGKQAFGSGVFTLEMKPKSGGATLKGKGKYFNVFAKQKDGLWKYAEGIWNFDKPPAETGARRRERDLGAWIHSANDELLKKGNIARVPEIFAPGYVAHVNGEDLRGHQAIERFITELREAFPDLRYEVEILSSGNGNASWIRTHHGTHKGTFMGLPASGRSITWRDMVVTRSEGGKIAEEWAVTDIGERVRAL